MCRGSTRPDRRSSGLAEEAPGVRGVHSKNDTDLKAQIAALQEAQKPAAPVPVQRPPVAAPPVAVPETSQVPIAHYPVDYYGTETRTRETANEEQMGAPRIDNEPMDPELLGYFRLPGTQTYMKFGGFVKTDLFYDLNFAGNYYGAYVPSSFPSTPTPHSEDSTVSMRPTRFTWEVRQGTLANTGKEVKIYFDFDFLSNYDRNSIRLRQFYAQYDNFLAGQAWSAFADPDAFPDTLEFEGPPGIIGLRSPQFRYTYPVSKHHSVGVSVEKSGTDVPFATQFGTPKGTSKWPDLVAFYRYENNDGHMHIATLFRNVGGIVPNEQVFNLNRHVGAYGISISGVWGLPFLQNHGNKDNLVFQFVIGKGISNYYNDNFGLGTDVGFNAEGRLVATPTGSVAFGYTHFWTKMLRSSVSLGYLKINNPAGDPPTTYHFSQYNTINLICQPTVRLLFGAEYIYGMAERKSDFEWVAPRLQASVTYYINKYPAPGR
ncbi:MAG TPA: DcaP family trimeric outer membrane transporter [Bryobacteraceae bacterium]|nr:DcaP family trimeric outer membrane transporter [Bryobacteraceae bacterium]